jgi:hypothetical protein
MEPDLKWLISDVSACSYRSFCRPLACEYIPVVFITMSIIAVHVEEPDSAILMLATQQIYTNARGSLIIQFLKRTSAPSKH